MKFRKEPPPVNDDAKHGSAPEKDQSLHYYHQDGALRAYANRAMVLAFLCVPATLVAIGLAAYVRMQPPTVIRVNETGEASVLGAKGPAITVAQGANSAPDDLEKKAFTRAFLERYLNFTPESVNRNWAEALNMMTSNLRRSTLNAMEKDNTVGKVEDEQITSVLHLHEIETSKDDPLTFTAYGVKEVHRISDHKETTSKLIGKFRIRLIGERRTEHNADGLLIAEFEEDVIENEQHDAIAQSLGLGGSK